MATTSSEYETDQFLPQKPEEPLPTDCCGSGTTTYIVHTHNSVHTGILITFMT